MSFDLKLSGGDLVIKNGVLVTVVDSDKLTQDILKIISTQLGSNPFFPGYGSPINQALVGTADVVSVGVAEDQLRSSIENLKTLQLQQIKNNQTVTPEEQISAIQDVSISQAKDDPRQFFVSITVINAANQRVPVSFAVIS
jgi:phage baseplate assembly protein W